MQVCILDDERSALFLFFPLKISIANLSILVAKILKVVLELSVSDTVRIYCFAIVPG